MSTNKYLDLKKKFSANLKALRKVKNITVKQLSEATSIEQSAINDYENKRTLPSVKRLITISNHFGISIDFLISGNETKYPKNLYLIFLSEKIDKLDQVKRFQIESTIVSLTGKKIEDGSKEDQLKIKLSDNFHENLKIIRQNKSLTQLTIATALNVTKAQISAYEKSKFPSVERLISLSNFLDVSMTALLTGQLLLFNFNNNDIRKAILMADLNLDLKEKDFLIILMEKIIENSKQ